MRTSAWMPLSAKKVMPVIIRLTTRVAAASSLVCRLNSAHQRLSRTHQAGLAAVLAAVLTAGVAAIWPPAGLEGLTLVTAASLGAPHLMADVTSDGHTGEVHLLQAGVGAGEGGIEIVGLGHKRQHAAAAADAGAIREAAGAGVEQL